ncbi:uncharacterized protein LOC110855697 [Folsomia candida]|uniref:uncharacterized protein LOC110855697 n=1 Tax=Folsomia candida TaxID=158441 RepID=UPI000B8FFCC0|nr:uncharacterized protein LOC110855697 [Folsomia candida]
MSGIKGLLVVIVGAMLTSQIHGQSNDTELVKVLFKRSEYVNQVFFQLLQAHLLARTNPIPEPMVFDNFTYSHEWLFQDGESHTYNPLLFGFSDSILTVHADNETYEANIHLVIPQASLTGTYDLWIDQSGFWGIYARYRGSGAYAHSFTNVELWLNLTVSEGMAGGRPIVTDVVTSLRFDSCRLWAENFSHNGNFWDEGVWAGRGLIFKEEFDSPDKAGGREILLTEGARSYMNMLFGFLGVDREQALLLLMDLGTIVNP